MRRMIPIMGGKWSLAKRYGPPCHDLVVEPFAGGAGYSLFHNPRNVLLVEKDPVVYSIWKFLQGSTEEDLRRLPIMFDSTDDLKICQEAKWFIGFWLTVADTAPRKRRTQWARLHIDTHPGSVWSERVRDRISREVSGIKHWVVIEGDYSIAPDQICHWFVDPPYLVKGVAYVAKVSSFSKLSTWCQNRQGFVQVCENEGADWLPFRPFHNGKGTEGKYRSGVTKEVLWEKSS